MTNVCNLPENFCIHSIGIRTNEVNHEVLKWGVINQLSHTYMFNHRIKLNWHLKQYCLQYENNFNMKSNIYIYMYYSFFFIFHLTAAVQI